MIAFLWVSDDWFVGALKIALHMLKFLRNAFLAARGIETFVHVNLLEGVNSLFCSCMSSKKATR